MADPIFQYHHRKDVSHSGYFMFSLSGVKYGHDGIHGLDHLVPLPELHAYQTSGTWVERWRNDTVDFRVPFEVECSADGSIKLAWRFRLPLDFGDFYNDAIEIAVSKSAGSPTAAMTVYHAAAADSVISSDSITPSTGGVWEIFRLTPGDAYLRGEWVTLVIVVSAVAGESMEFSDLSIGYTSGMGNVTGIVG